MKEQIKTKKGSRKPVEYKALSVSTEGLLVSEDSRTISGYAAVFNNIDNARDMIIKGAFTKSLNERGVGSKTNRKIAFLWQHDMGEPLGSLTELKEDDFGLYFEAVLDNIPEADRALEQLKSGTLNQFSIGYQYVWDKMEWDEEKECFICKELNLFEISVVTIGCNELTGFSGMKAEQLDSEANRLQRDTEKILKNLPNDTQYAIRQLIAKHIALAEAEPLPALPTNDKPHFELDTALKNIKIIP